MTNPKNNKKQQNTKPQKQAAPKPKAKPPPVPPKPQHLQARRIHELERKQAASPGVVGGVLRALGAVGGGIGGAFMGSPFAGAKAGWDVGAGVSQWAGLGKYRIRRNVLLTSQEPANFASVQDGVIITHREYLGDLLAGTGSPTLFNIQSYALNPSNQNTFPWMSSLALNFQEWEPLGIICEYIPQQAMSSINNTSNNLGSVFIVTQYDADQNAPSNKNAVLNEMYSVTGRPCDKLVMPIECDMSQNVFKNLFVAPGGVVPLGADLKTYLLGTLFIGSQGIPYAADILGQIWLTYKIRLRKPGLMNNLTPAIGSDGIFLHLGSVATTAYTNTNTLWNTAATSVTIYQSSIGPTPVVTASRIYFARFGTVVTQAAFGSQTPPPNLAAFQCPPGLYSVSVTWKGTSTAQTVNGPTSSGTGIAAFNYFQGDTQSSVGSGGLTGTTATLVTVVQIAPSGQNTCYLEYNNTQTLPTSGTDVDILVSYLGPTPSGNF